MNRGPIHIAYGRVDEHDDTDFDCIDSEPIPTTSGYVEGDYGYVIGSHILIQRTLPDGQELTITATVG